MNLKVVELFSLKIEYQDEKVWDSGIIELKGPKNLFDIMKVRDSRVRDTEWNYKVTRKAEETKEKVQDSESLR